MLSLSTVAGIVLALVSVICIFRFAMKAMRRDEARLKAMSSEIEAIISEAAAGQSESLLPAPLLPLVEEPRPIAAPETDKVVKAPCRKAVKTNHGRCASDFVPHQYRPDKHQDEIAA